MFRYILQYGDNIFPQYAKSLSLWGYFLVHMRELKGYPLTFHKRKEAKEVSPLLFFLATLLTRFGNPNIVIRYTVLSHSQRDKLFSYLVSEEDEKLMLKAMDWLASDCDWSAGGLKYILCCEK